MAPFNIIVSIFLQIFNFLIVFADQCIVRQNIQSCNFSLPKNPIYQVTSAVHLGLSQSQCTDKMQRFDWPVGIFCGASFFCGVGFVSEGEISKILGNDDSSGPTTEMCDLMINLKETDCSTTESKLYEVGILLGEQSWFRERKRDATKGTVFRIILRNQLVLNFTKSESSCF